MGHLLAWPCGGLVAAKGMPPTRPGAKEEGVGGRRDGLGVGAKDVDQGWDGGGGWANAFAVA